MQEIEKQKNESALGFFGFFFYKMIPAEELIVSKKKQKKNTLHQ